VQAWRACEKALEVARNLRAFEAAGVRATYHVCDVSDPGSLAGVLDDIRRVDGPIKGVVHGAGVETAARFDRKVLARVQATMGAKVDGAANLIALTSDDPLDFFVAFGSVSGRFGGVGQTDYSMASDLMAKLVSAMRRRRPGCRATTIHWPAWADVGMAMRPESRVVLEAAGQKFMPLAEGCAHLLSELDAGCPEAEVLFCTSDMPAAAQGLTQANETTDACISECLVSDSPLVDGINDMVAGRSMVAEVRLDSASDPFLIEHLFQGVPILPAAVALECLMQAARVFEAGRVPSVVHDFHAVNGLRFPSQKALLAELHIAADEAGLKAEIRADFRNRAGRLTDPGRVYFRGVLARQSVAEIYPEAVPEPPKEWADMPWCDQAQAITENRVYHGPPLRGLRSITARGDEAWGRIVALPWRALAGRRSGSGWLTPTAGLDACLVLASALLYFNRRLTLLPEKFDRVTFGRPPGENEACLGYVKLREIADGRACFDISLVGANSELVLEIRGFRGVVPLSQRAK
jgi:hypothetical protein